MDIRRDLDSIFQDWDQGSVAGGPFGCRYEEDYTESLDVQGVSRSLTMPRHIAAEIGIVYGSQIDYIRTIDQRVVGPFTVETVEPASDGTVLFRLRDQGVAAIG